MDWYPVRYSPFTSLFTSYSLHTRRLETNVPRGKVYLWNILLNLGRRAEHVILEMMHFLYYMSLPAWRAKTMAVALYTMCAIFENGAYAIRKKMKTRCMK